MKGLSLAILSVVLIYVGFALLPFPYGIVPAAIGGGIIGNLAGGYAAFMNPDLYRRVK